MAVVKMLAWAAVLPGLCGSDRASVPPWRWLDRLSAREQHRHLEEAIFMEDLCSDCQAPVADGRSVVPLPPSLVVDGASLCEDLRDRLDRYGVAVVLGMIDEMLSTALADAIDVDATKDDVVSWKVIEDSADVVVDAVRYLPERIAGHRVIVAEKDAGKFRVDDFEVRAAGVLPDEVDGIALRKSINVTDIDFDTGFLEFGTRIKGELVDGWLKVQGPVKEHRQVRFNAPLPLEPADALHVLAFQEVLGKLGPCYEQLMGANATLKEFAAMLPRPHANAQYVHPDLSGPSREHPDKHQILSTFLYAAPVTLDNGALDVWPGTHTVDFAEFVRERGIRAREALPLLSPGIRVAPLPPGSVALYFGHLLHRGSANRQPWAPSRKGTRSSLMWSFMSEVGSDPGERLAYEMESTFTMHLQYKGMVKLEAARLNGGVYKAHPRPLHVNRGCKRCHESCATCLAFDQVHDVCPWSHCESCLKGFELMPLQLGDAGAVGRCVAVTETSKGCRHCHESCATCSHVADDPDQQPEDCGETVCTSCHKGHTMEGGRCFLNGVETQGAKLEL